jgi:hypothetical protein
VCVSAHVRTRFPVLSSTCNVPFDTQRVNVLLGIRADPRFPQRAETVR